MKREAFKFQPHPCPDCKGGKTSEGTRCKSCLGTGTMREYVVLQDYAATVDHPAGFSTYAARNLCPSELSRIYYQSPDYREAQAVQVQLNMAARKEWQEVYRPNPPKVCQECGQLVQAWPRRFRWCDSPDPEPQWLCGCSYYWPDGRKRSKWTREYQRWHEAPNEHGCRR
jgi:hypothetical protein